MQLNAFNMLNPFNMKFNATSVPYDFVKISNAQIIANLAFSNIIFIMLLFGSQREQTSLAALVYAFLGVCFLPSRQRALFSPFFLVLSPILVATATTCF